jgi:sugar phosphate permease
MPQHYALYFGRYNDRHRQIENLISYLSAKLSSGYGINMALGIYIAGGLLLWLGGYDYLKTRYSIGMRPTGGLEVVYACCGWLAQILVIPYLIAMGIAFTWWAPVPFFIIGSVATGFVYSKLAGGAGGFTVLCVPLGVALASVTLALIR